MSHSLVPSGEEARLASWLIERWKEIWIDTLRSCGLHSRSLSSATWHSTTTNRWVRLHVLDASERIIVSGATIGGDGLEVAACCMSLLRLRMERLPRLLLLRLL